MAITDTFLKRYAKQLVQPGVGISDAYLAFFRQAMLVLVQDVQPRLQRADLFFSGIHDKFAR